MRLERSEPCKYHIKKFTVFKCLKHTCFSIYIIISHNWQGPPFNILMPLMVALFPGSDADSTGEHMDDALSRSMCSICGRKGPPRTS